MASRISSATGGCFLHSSPSSEELPKVDLIKRQHAAKSKANILSKLPLLLVYCCFGRGSNNALIYRRAMKTFFSDFKQAPPSPVSDSMQRVSFENTSSLFHLSIIG